MVSPPQEVMVPTDVGELDVEFTVFVGGPVV